MNSIFAGQVVGDQLSPVLVPHQFGGKVKRVESTDSIAQFYSFLDTEGNIYCIGSTDFGGKIVNAQKLAFDKKIKDFSGMLMVISEEGKIYGMGNNKKSRITPAFANKRINTTDFNNVNSLANIVETSYSSNNAFFTISKSGVVYGHGGTASGKKI